MIKLDSPLAELAIPKKVLDMINISQREDWQIMPVRFDSDTGVLHIVTSEAHNVYRDLGLILKSIRKEFPEVNSLDITEILYEDFIQGYQSHYKQRYTNDISSETEEKTSNESMVSSAQTKLVCDILQRAIAVNASDIHFIPNRNSTAIVFRVDGKPADSGFTALPARDEIIIVNYLKRLAGLEVNNLVGQDGRFSMFDHDFRFNSSPANETGSNRNAITIRVGGSTNQQILLDDLGFSDEEVNTIRRFIYKPSGIVLVCGPTGEGKSTTLYACLQELRNENDRFIFSIEDPIERYIDGVAQCQYHESEDEKTTFSFSKAIRGFMRSDPDIILVGEIRDKATAVAALQASQTGHLILSTLHAKNSVAVFDRMKFLGVETDGFVEQLEGIVSQRLLSTNCPYCMKKVVSKYNVMLRQCDLDKLEYGVDDYGKEGYLSYESVGCSECKNTGYAGKKTVLEIIGFDNYLRDFFNQSRSLIETERHLREKYGFKSLWDNGMSLVADKKISLKELIQHIHVDIDFTKNKNSDIE